MVFYQLFPDCDFDFNNCKTNCVNITNKKTCMTSCDNEYYKCKNQPKNNDEEIPTTRVCNKTKYDKLKQMQKIHWC